MNKIKVFTQDTSGDQVAIFVDACCCGHELRLTPQKIDQVLLSIDGILIDQATAHELSVLLQNFWVFGTLEHPMVFNNTFIGCEIVKKDPPKSEAVSPVLGIPSTVAAAIEAARLQLEASDGHDPLLYSAFADLGKSDRGTTLDEALTYVQENTKDPDMAARCYKLLDVVRSKADPDNPGTSKDADSVPVGETEWRVGPGYQIPVKPIEEEPKPETWRDRKPLL